MQDLEFSEIVGLICKEDSRFERQAYTFVRQALDHTVKELKRKNPERTGKSLHVSGAELLQGIRLYALDQFGPMTKTVRDAAIMLGTMASVDAKDSTSMDLPVPDYEKLFLGELPTMYHVQDTWENYDLLKSQIDKRFAAWRKKRGSA